MGSLSKFCQLSLQWEGFLTILKFTATGIIAIVILNVREIKLKRILTKVKLAPCSTTSFTVNEIKNFMSERNYQVHLERGMKCM